MLKVSKHLAKEQTNANNFLQEQTKDMILKIVRTEAIENYAKEITELPQGCAVMFEQRKKDELKLVYTVFVQIEPTLQTIIDKMDPYIKAEGLKIVQSEEL